MDLVLKDADGRDLMVLAPDSADFAWGSDENDFELVFSDGPNRPQFVQWGYVYYYGTEWGGMLTHVTSEDGKVRWKGPTWAGMLQHKVLVPDAGKSHLTVSGEANVVLAQLIERIGLASCMSASPDSSGISIGRYQFDLYEDAYDGIIEMLDSVGAKLRIRHDGERAVLSALPAKDWSSDEEFDSDLVDVFVDVDGQPVNHLVGRGGGEEEERIAVELYMDADGNVSETQTLKGALESAEYYDYTNADRDKLVEDGTKRLKGYWGQSRSVSVRLSASNDRYDVGDTVGGTDSRTGISATARVSKKVLSVDSYGTATVSYETE